MAHHWLNNFRFTEYRGVQVVAGQHFGPKGSQKATMLQCSKTGPCAGISGVKGGKFSMVKAMQLAGGSGNHRVFHKSGKKLLLIAGCNLKNICVLSSCLLAF